MRSPCLAVLSLLALVSPAWSTTLQVPAMYPTIQGGIDAALPGDTVLVAPGTYSGIGNRDLDFGGKDLVLRSEAGPAATIIDGQDTGRGLYFHGHETPAARVEGFTIRNGFHPQTGGAIHSDNSSPTISHCVIERSHAQTGGAISCFYFSSPSFEDCRISGNSAQEGGAVYCFYARYPEFNRCVMTGNLASSAGGALSSRYSSAPVLRNCTVAGNRAANGGGIHIYAASASAERTIIWGNCAAQGSVAYIATATPLVLTCCDVDSMGMAGPGSASYNGPQAFSDPLFCGALSCAAAPSEGGDYSLNVASPCVPAHSPCGAVIGAEGAACGAETGVSANEATPIPAQPSGLDAVIHPNPSRSATTIAFSLPARSRVRVSIVDARGRELWSRGDGVRDAGRQSILWEGVDTGGLRVPPGIYFARVETDLVSETLKLVIVE